jgi:hypothetical protein
MEPIAISRLLAHPAFWLNLLILLEIVVDAPGFEPGTR